MTRKIFLGKVYFSSRRRQIILLSIKKNRIIAGEKVFQKEIQGEKFPCEQIEENLSEEDRWKWVPWTNLFYFHSSYDSGAHYDKFYSAPVVIGGEKQEDLIDIYQMLYTGEGIRYRLHLYGGLTYQALPPEPLVPYLKDFEGNLIWTEEEQKDILSMRPQKGEPAFWFYKRRKILSYKEG